MTKASYKQTSFPVEAEQFVVATTPWTSGVTQKESGNYVLASELGELPIVNGEWVVTTQGRVSVWSDAHFSYGFIAT